MKTEFNNMTTQRIYINAFILRYTTLEKTCQFCGNPAMIVHNRENPYKIRFVCASCRKTHKNDIDQLEYIDLLDYLIDSSVLKHQLTEKDYSMIDDIIINKLSANQITKKYHISSYTLKSRLALLEKENVGKYLSVTSALEENSSNAIRQASLNRMTKKQYPNNINQIKLEKNIVNKDIAKYVSTTPANIASISNGSTKISIKKKCLIAEALKESVARVFPEEIYFNEIYSYTDFLKHIQQFRNNVLKEMDRKKIKISKFYDGTLSECTIRNAIYDEERSCTTEAIQHIARILDIDPYILINQKL